MVCTFYTAAHVHTIQTHNVCTMSSGFSRVVNLLNYVENFMVILLSVKCSFYLLGWFCVLSSPSQSTSKRRKTHNISCGKASEHIFSNSTEKKLIAFICNRRTLHRWDGKQIKNERMLLLRIWRISYNKLVSSLSCARLNDTRVHIPYYINRLKFHSPMKYDTKEVFTLDSLTFELNQ